MDQTVFENLRFMFTLGQFFLRERNLLAPVLINIDAVRLQDKSYVRSFWFKK